jgi:hypothetical protein
LQGNCYTYGIKYEVDAGYNFKDHGSYVINEYGRFIDVFDEYMTKYMFFCEHPDSIHGWPHMCSPDCSKTCDEIP